jgi:hypothetical protein
MCNLTAGFTLDCKDSVGGVKSIHLINWAKTGFSIGGGEATATTVASGSVYTYEMPKATGSMTITTNVSQENGTVFNQTDIVARLRKLSTAKRNELKLLSQGRAFCIVRDNSDNYWLCGREYGCDITALTGETGTAMGDNVGYNFTLSAIEAEAPYKLTATVVTALGI